MCSHDLRAQEEALISETMLWEDDPVCAFVCTQFDPAQGDRRMLACNRRAAELMDMHKEELLARYAHREVYVPFVEADWLANFVHDLDYGDEPRNERYIRTVWTQGGARRPYLMQNTKVKVFDSFGRVSRVPAPLHIGSIPKPCTVLHCACAALCINASLYLCHPAPGEPPLVLRVALRLLQA